MHKLGSLEMSKIAVTVLDGVTGEPCFHHMHFFVGPRMKTTPQ